MNSHENICDLLKFEVAKYVATQENKQKFITDLIDDANITIMSLLPDDIINQFSNLSDEYLKKFIELFSGISESRQIGTFVGKILNLLCSKFNSNPSIFQATQLINNNVKHISLELCKVYCKNYQINLAYIAEHHSYSEIYNEFMTVDNASTYIKLAFSKFEADPTTHHVEKFIMGLTPDLFQCVIKHASSLTTDRYNLLAILTSPHLTRNDIVAMKKQPKISKSIFTEHVPGSIIESLNETFIDWLVSDDTKLKLSIANLQNIENISKKKEQINKMYKLLQHFSIETFKNEQTECSKQIVENILRHVNLNQLWNFSVDLLKIEEVMEVYKRVAPPLIVLARSENVITVDEICQAISETKLNEKCHLHAFEYFYFPTLIEFHLTNPKLKDCLKNVTIPLRKVIVKQVVDNYKRLQKSTLLNFNEIYPVIIKKIYAKFLELRLPKLVVMKINMNEISLSNEEILDMCLVKEEFECGVCYHNQMNILCTICGHGICSSCEVTIKKNNCSWCREKYNYVSIKS